MRSRYTVKVRYRDVAVGEGFVLPEEGYFVKVDDEMAEKHLETHLVTIRPSTDEIVEVVRENVSE